MPEAKNTSASQALPGLGWCGVEVVVILYLMLENVTNNIVLRMQSISDMMLHWLDKHFFNVLTILIVAWVVRRLATAIVERLIRATVRPEAHQTKTDREKRIKTLHSLAVGVIKLITYLVSTVLIVGEIWPGSTSLLLTSAGLLGVMFGFGAQNLVRDITSGIFIIIENQYRIGDQVTLMTPFGSSVEGIVEDIYIRTTVLRDLSGTAHHIPNGNISLTSNKTLGFSRLSEEITVAIDTDMELLEKAIKQVSDEMTSDPELKDRIVDPPQLANVLGFRENGVLIRVSAKTKPAEQWKIRSEFYKHLRKSFERNKIKLVGQ